MRGEKHKGELGCCVLDKSENLLQEDRQEIDRKGPFEIALST